MTETAAPTGPDRGTALATTGFLMAATGPILVVAGSLLWGLDSAQAVFFVVPALLGLLAAFEFDRATYDVAGGATILVKNSDPFVHTFTVDALDIDVDLGPGSETLVTIPAEPGTYVLFCQPHSSDKDDPGEDDMAAVLEVG